MQRRMNAELKHSRGGKNLHPPEKEMEFDVFVE